MDFPSNSHRHSMDYSSSGSSGPAPGSNATPNRHSTGTMLVGQQLMYSPAYQSPPNPGPRSSHHNQSSLSNIVIPEEDRGSGIVADLSSLYMGNQGSSYHQLQQQHQQQLRSPIGHGQLYSDQSHSERSRHSELYGSPAVYSSPYSPMSPHHSQLQQQQQQHWQSGTPSAINTRASPTRQTYMSNQHSPITASSVSKPMYVHGSPRPPSMSSVLHHRSSASQLGPSKIQVSPVLNQQPLYSPGSSTGAPNIPAPMFRHVRSMSEIPHVRHGPAKYRRALPEGGFMSPTSALTVHLPSTYHICNPEFTYESSRNPRRVLTKPSEGKLNNGYDNTESDYILYVNDILGTDEQRRYLVLDTLGQGTFGQVVKCQDMINKEIVAIKVIKNKPAYLSQSMMEVSILEHLNNHVDKNGEHNLLRLKDRFMHKGHLCLVFELLNSNLYELIKQNQFRGLSTNLVRVFAQQMLDCLMVLKEARIIHCDLKPENILLKSLDSPVIKIIDFGSACHERQTVYSYIQSRFYRSPEVILGLPYTTSIDMWSLGCIVVELFLGLPIFPGTSEYNQLSRITESLGKIPNWMVEMGKNSGQFMEKYTDEYGRKQYRLKSREKYSKEFNTDEQPSKQYFPSTNLREIIMNYPLPRRNHKDAEIEREMQNRASFVDFVQGLLNMNPFERWTAHEAANHPFIKGVKLDKPFVPRSESKNEGRYQRNSASMMTGQMSSDKQHQHQHQQQPQPLQNISQMQHIQSIPILSPSSSNSYNKVGQHGGSNAGSGSYGINETQQSPANHHMFQHMKMAPTMSQQALNHSSRRPRATTIGQLDSIPSQIQRAGALINPSQAIHAQASPAYIPPPELYGQSSQRASYNTQGGSGDVIRNLENGLGGYK